MKVKELQEKLAKFDPEMELICFCEDENSQKEGRLFTLFDISSVSATDATRCRLDDRTPYLKLGKDQMSETLVFLEVTSDF